MKSSSRRETAEPHRADFEALYERHSREVWALAYARWLNADLARSKREVVDEREAEPTAVIVDCQTVQTTEAGGDRGFDGGKKGDRAQTAGGGGHRWAFAGG